MATIRKTERYLTYLVALFVSAVFSLFGRPTPVWAEEVRSEQGAKVFREMYQVAQAAPGGKQGGGKSAQPIVPERPIMTGKTGTASSQPSREMSWAVDKDSKAQRAVDERVQELLDSAARKAESAPQEITPEEAVLVRQTQMEQKIDELSNQLGVLLKMLKETK